MSTHYEEEAQVEQLRRWWRENWMALAGGLVLGLAGIFGWEAWQNSRAAKSEKASQIYEDLRKLGPDQAARAAELGKSLTTDFAGTPYATQAALQLANLSVQSGNFDEARGHLEWAVANSRDPGLKKIARLRLARVLWQLDRSDDALKQLDVADDDAFAALFQELRGDILLGKGDRAGARGAYEKALAIGPQAASRQGLQRKLDDLAGAAS